MTAFSNLSPGFSHQVANVGVTCSNIEPSIDYRGVEFNRIFWFNILGSDICGAITVHLHHTTRLVQVQGSAVMYDGQVAAVWFVKNLLLGLFTRLSKDKGHDISAFNDAVLQNKFNTTNDKSISDSKCDLCNKIMKQAIAEQGHSQV